MENKSSKVNRCEGCTNGNDHPYNDKCYTPTPYTIEEEEFNEDAKVIDMLEGRCEHGYRDPVYVCPICPQQDTEEQSKCKHLKCGCGKYLIGDSELELDGICHRPYLPCYIISSPKNENEDWEEKLLKVLMRDKVLEDYEVYETIDFIKSLISTTKEGNTKEIQEYYERGQEEAYKRGKAEAKAEFIEKIRTLIRKSPYRDDINYNKALDDLLTSPTKE